MIYRTKKELKEFERYDKSLKHAYSLWKGKYPAYSFELRVHPVATLEPQVKKLIGYYPSGYWQVLVKKGKKEWSIIKGMISFGYFEIMRLRPKSKDPERFGKLKDLIDYLK